MKKLLLISLCFVLCLPLTAYAGGSYDPCDSDYKSKIYNECSPHTVDTDTDTHRNDKSSTDLKTGVKLDAPNIIRLTKNTTLGVEGGKDLLGTNRNEGWFVFGKITWTGTFFDFTKDKGE